MSQLENETICEMIAALSRAGRAALVIRELRNVVTSLVTSLVTHWQHLVHFENAVTTKAGALRIKKNVREVITNTIEA